MRTYIIIAASAFACGIIILLIRSPGAFKRFIAGAAAGLVVLATVNLTSALTGITIAVSGWSIAVAGLLGLPGVVSMLLIKSIWQI